MFQQRRDRLLAAMGPNTVAIIPSAPVFIRNNDVEHEYRPDSDVYYLTGFQEPDSVLVLLPGHAEHQVVMFVRARDPDREVWDGPRSGVEGAIAQFGANAAFPITEFDTKLPELLAQRARLYYSLGTQRAFDDRVLRAIATVRARSRKGGYWPTEIVELATLLHELRWEKNDVEIEIMRRGAEITRDAFRRAFETARAGRHEYEVEAVLREAFRGRGADRPAYQPIVASGSNACVLHYVANNRRMEDGDLLLIDAGAEYGCYACDVTRTFPLSGRFTEPQRKIYQLVLDAQLASIAEVKPGSTIEKVHRRSVEVITEGLVRYGILEGPVEERIKDESFKRYFMHGTSHWLGLDVHDVGRYYIDGASRPLQPGCVLTVEPGVYIPPGDERVPAEFRGIGVRIEDDVLCTAEGQRVLTHDIPKAVDELESILHQRSVAAA